MQESGDTVAKHSHVTPKRTNSLIQTFATVFTIIEDVFWLVALLTRLVLFMPPGSFMCYGGAHVAVCGHGAAGSRVPPA